MGMFDTAVKTINSAWKASGRAIAWLPKKGFDGTKALMMNENALIKWGSRGAVAATAVAVGKSIFSKDSERVEQMPPEMVAQQQQLAANQQVINTLEQNAQAQAVVDAPLIAAAQNIQAQQEAQAAQQQAQAEKAMQTANTPESTNQITEMLANMPAEASSQPDYQVSNMQPHGAISQGQQQVVNA